MAALACVVIERVVLHAAVVPHHERAWLPLHAAGEDLLGRLADQETQKVSGLVAVEASDADREGTVHIERLLARLRVGAHDGMGDEGARQVGLLRLHGFVESGASAIGVLRPRRVDADQPVEHLFHGLAQRVIGRVLIREQGVAAALRDVDGIENRAEIGFFEEGDIGVPSAAEVEDVVGLGDDVDHLRVLRVALDERMRVELTESTTEAHLLLRRELLIPKHQDVVLDERGADRSDCLARELSAEIETSNGRAESAGQWAEIELRHLRDGSRQVLGYHPAVSADAVFHRFTERLETLATHVVGSEFPDAPTEQIEHLIEQVAGFVEWEVFHADPARPMFHRHNDLVHQWGGPNADNVYRHARISPDRRYRITGRMHSCDQWLLAIRKGFMHNEVWGTVEQLTASDLGIGPGDEFELTLGGEDEGDRHISLGEGVIMASFREYYYDWAADEPATMIIECLDDPGPTPAVTVDELTQRLDRAYQQVEDSMTYWNRYMVENRDEREPNVFASGLAVAKGLSAARYAFNFWDLAPDEAIFVEADVPAADYWALQLYRMGTFELTDLAGRASSRNHRQTQLSADGRIRAVISPVDVGAANWLDTGGRATGLCTFRWFWPHDDSAPAIESRVVKVGELESLMGADTPRVTYDERAAELAARRAHLAWRFRS